MLDDESKAHVTDSEPMSKIEEELEAELARLELNITSNCLKEQTFDFSEVTVILNHYALHLNVATFYKSTE